MKQPSQRQLRVAEQLKGVISNVLHRGHFSDPVLFDHARDVTVGAVDASPDLKNAKVFVMTLNADHLKDVLTALNANRHYFQKSINAEMNIKFTPKLHFVEDETFAEAQRIEKLLSSIR
jgi:ribosome-binding factor A